MASFSIDEVIRATGGKLLGGAGDVRFSGISTDSRKILPGELFVAIIGERFDGHKFLGDALAAGAAGAVISELPSGEMPGSPLIHVPDTRQALLGLARWHRMRFEIPVAAITGSTGKTTTKDMAFHVLRQRFRTLRSEANFNNEIGLAQVLLSLSHDVEALVVELGMRAPGEIRDLARAALPSIGAITNVGVTHIERLGSQENIAKAKRELIEELPQSGVAILNADDPYVIEMAPWARGKVLTYGIRKAADLCASDIKDLGISGTGCTFNFRGQRFDVQIPAPGIHHVYDALAASCIGLALGLEPSEIREGLLRFVPSPMRMEVIRLDGDIILINDAYNSNPTSLESSLRTLEAVGAGRRKIAILGDMLELGPIAWDAHVRMGELALAAGVDILITVGECSLAASDRAKALGMKEDRVHHYSSNREAASMAAKTMAPGDCILVKGSRGMKMEEIVRALRAGDLGEVKA